MNALVVLFVLCTVGRAACQTPVWDSEFTCGVMVSSLSGSGSPSAIDFVGDYTYSVSAAASSYLLFDRSTGLRQRLTTGLQAASGGSYPTCTQSAQTGSCAFGNGTSLDALSAPTLLFALPPSFLKDYGFKLVGQEYYRRELTYYATNHYSYANARVQVDYYHCTDLNVPFRLVVGWTPATYFASWSPIVVEFQTNYVGSLTAQQRADASLPQASACAKLVRPAPLPSLPGSTSSPPPASLKPADWPLQFNAQATFTGNTFGTLTTKLPRIELVGHFYYDSPGDRECNYWEDVTSGERSKTLIVDGAFHAVTFSSGACVEPPVPIKDSLKSNWTQNLAYQDQRWLVRGTVNPLVGDFWLNAQHFAWDAFNAGPTHAFQYNQLPTGEPLLFQGPVYDFPPYLQSFSTYSAFEVGLQGLNTTNIYSVPANCQVISPSAFDLLMSPHFDLDKLHAAASSSPAVDELLDLHSRWNLVGLRRVTAAALLPLRARGLVVN